MAETEQRKHERILISMPTRMWLQEPFNGKDVQFEGYSATRDLAIGGTFLRSDYLLPVGFPLNLEMHIGGDEYLIARGEVVHTISGSEGHEPGMGIMFTEVDAENRERLLRFFVSDRIRDFYNNRFVIEFPHLEAVLSLMDVALILNLWEDKQGRLSSLRKPEAGRARRKRRDDEVQATKRRVRR